jgi:prevent-host-death family protein
MEISVSTLRAELKQWIEKARSGEDVVITERGIPVARLSGIASSDLLTRLQREGLLTAPEEPRPAAATEERPSPRTGAGVSGLVRRLRR